MHTPRNSHGKVFHNLHDSAKAQLARDTDTCVKCALCLPVCPTYALNRTETQSPRGRVSLAQAMANGQLAPEQARPAFDACLTCLACETVCPARVPYGAIIDRARQLSGGPTGRESLVANVLSRPWAVRILGALHRLSRALPLPRPLARLRALPGPVSSAPPLGEPGPPRTALTTSLLVGCLSSAFDRATVDSFTALFHAVGLPMTPVDGCCGALARHTGDEALAARLHDPMVARLSAGEGPIAHVASGCAAGILQSVQSHPPNAGGVALKDRVADPFVILRDADLAERLSGRRGPLQRVVLHEPCTQRNSLEAGGVITDLLHAVDGLEVTVARGHGCCGAAGSHMLTQPKAATSLADALLDDIPDPASVDVLLTSNIGCAWHLRGALFDRGAAMNVMHPATFLARCL
ncbi:MAG: (Fe-S)-binding protein [Pseudomonadota bacterium]